MEEMYQNNDDKIRQIEKKFFHSLKKSCIIDKLEKGFFMFFHSRTAKIISFSIVGFCAGLCLTLITFLSFDRPNHKRGVGGYETSVLPELDENISSLLSELSETEESYETDKELIESETETEAETEESENSEKIEDTLESEESTEKNDDSDESDEPIIDEPISEELSEQEKIDDIVIENENTEQDGSDLSTEIIEENVQDEVEVE